MDWFTGIASFFTIWWVVIFVTLPLGVRSQAEAGGRPEGSDPGAPVKPDLKRKMLLTTGISAVVWLIVAAIIEFRLISFDW
jgi:predicted secreted protein